jgi:hypothetical protein
MVVVGIVVGILLVLLMVAFEASRTQTDEKPAIQRVTLQSGDSSVTVRRSGSVTMRLPQGVFQQQWDEQRVREFFARFTGEDFTAFAAFGDESEGYLLTIVTEDGQEQTYVLPFLDVPIPEVVEELIEALEEFAQAVPTPMPTPTPTPVVLFPTPTPAPSGDGGGVIQKLFECDFSDPESAANVLSQTVCTLIY